MSHEHLNGNWVALSEASRMVGKTKRQIRYMVDQGRLEAAKIGGRWFVSRDDLLSQGFKPQFFPGDSSTRGGRGCGGSKPAFFEVDMRQIMDQPSSGFEVEPAPKTLEATASMEQAMHVHISSRDGSNLEMIIPRADGCIVEQLVRSFLGG